MYTYLQSVQTSEAELTLHLDEANKLARELSDLKKELKATMFDNNLASFNAFPDFSDMSLLGELTFTHIQLPFKKLDITSVEFKPVDIPARFDFLLPLEHGERIVVFERFFKRQFPITCGITKMRCLDRLGRMIRSSIVVSSLLWRGKVSQCGPSKFVVCHDTAEREPELSVYDSDLNCLRNVRCKDFTNIYCNCKFVFGLWEDERELVSNPDDEQYSSRRIQVCHVDTLTEVFSLRVPKKYMMERIMADEHRAVVISRLKDSEPSSQWFMSNFYLQTLGKEIGGERDSKNARGEKAEHFFLIERKIDLNLDWVRLQDIFMLDGWLAVPRNEEIIWFDKEGNRSETSTDLDTNELRGIYSSNSNLLFVLNNDKVFVKRCLDVNNCDLSQ